VILNIFFALSLFTSLSIAADNESEKDSGLKIKTREYFLQRQKEEKAVSKSIYSLLSHKPFYFMPVTYTFNTLENETYPSLGKTDSVEAKFQFSFKIDVIESFFKDHMQLSFAYTNLSYWQVYNKQNSAAFRETNHEPDLFISYFPETVDSINNKWILSLGVVHESNGQNVETSRSWNRVYVQGHFILKYVVLNLKVWQRIKEGAKSTPEDPEGDDNPDIVDFMGRFQGTISSKVGASTLSLSFRNNLKSRNKGALEFSWSFPLKDRIRGYFQYFDGYGESLIDYDRSIRRIGLGISIGDHL
jgi:phospholipase A1